MSRARADLPDFLGLATNVVKNLGVPSDDPALKILDETREVERRTGIPGLVSLDRVFGALERDLPKSDIEGSVAGELVLSTNPDVSAHKTMLDLATTSDGAVRIVTTNFDRLFDHCGHNLKSWLPPSLPDPEHINGIVYLHGKVGPDYQGAERGGFVLSSSEFGRAYLSEGWATSFIREVLDRYVVVFIGYSADDPPIHYLLEALKKTAGSMDRTYAFQSGDIENASAKWLHKGVTAIPYDSREDHKVLWKTLEAWACRARDPDQWYAEVTGTAKAGPKDLSPYIRGQVAHIVSTTEGLKHFSEGNSPPPAEWLCVFDPGRRYAKPGYAGDFQSRGPFVDPFDYYAIDSDAVPARVDPDDHYVKRDVPTDCWDVFSLTRADRADLDDNSFPFFRGYQASAASRLPTRLHQLGIWLGKVAFQPTAVWWAVRQGSLHPGISNLIRWELNHSITEFPPGVQHAWRYLLEYCEANNHYDDCNGYALVDEIKQEGWSGAIVRKYASCFRPHLTIKNSYWAGPIPGDLREDIRWSDLIHLDVEYPTSGLDIDIPDEWLIPVIASLRKNLELAHDLETEIGGYGLSGITPINPSDDPDQNDLGRGMGLSGAVIRFSSLFGRLITLDPEAARVEFSQWMNDDYIFSRLRIWAIGEPSLLPPDMVAEVIMQLSDSAFWDSHHQRDLLLALLAQWMDLSVDDRGIIENRILQGPNQWDQESDDKYHERHAWASLQRLSWLQQSECELRPDTTVELQELSAAVSEWNPGNALTAADSLEGRGGMVRTDTDFSTLVDEPLANILSKAKELSGRQDDFLVEKDPFAGLVRARPVKAFAVLRLASKNNDFPEWAWRSFLNSEARKFDSPRLTVFIAEQLTRFKSVSLASIIGPVADWIRDTSEMLAVQAPESFRNLVKRVVDVLSTDPDKAASAIQRRNDAPDWVMEAINSPTGILSQALFKDPQKDDLKTGEGFPAEWLNLVNSMLELPGNLRSHALVIFTHNLNWFYAIEPEWSEQKLLAILESDSISDKEAFWGGFFWGARVPSQSLYLHLKPYLLEIAEKGGLSRRDHTEVLSGIILAGWGSIQEDTDERFISDEELRNILIHSEEDFRLRVIWQIQQWATSKDDKHRSRWGELLPQLLANVWPRQISAKSSRISERLCDLAFAIEERFAELVDILVPLLTNVEHDHLILPHLRKSRDGIVDNYPKKMIDILYAVLPKNARGWPHDSGETLTRILEADNSLSDDKKFIELKRIWDSR
ncbi:MAG: hypothetical protein GY696_33885 [Gammaproteobacteria bacterium]|nr:hypothetical protein [Gammaproteobacteria bacterium]